LNPDDDRKTEKLIEQIRRRAVKHGIYDDRAKPQKKGDLPGQKVMWEE
jgi:hypothetical protein